MKTKITTLILALTASLAGAANAPANMTLQVDAAASHGPARNEFTPPVDPVAATQGPASAPASPVVRTAPGRHKATEQAERIEQPAPPKKGPTASKKAAPKLSIAATVAAPNKIDPMLDAYRQWSGRSLSKSAIVKGVWRFSFEEAEPVIICAEFRVCMLDLNEDEIVEFIAAGDPTNWEVQPLQQGKHQVVSIRAKAPDLHTNLVIATDKRTYTMELKATKEEFISRYAFDYNSTTIKNYSGVFKHPLDESDIKRLAADRAESERQAALPKKSEYQRDFESTFPSATTPLIAYELKGDFPFKPVRVYSDGSKTFVEMPQNIVSKELPALFILNAQGGMGMPTPRYNLAKRMFTVDFVIEKAVLMLGSGRESQKVEINQIAK